MSNSTVFDERLSTGRRSIYISKKVEYKLTDVEMLAYRFQRQFVMTMKNIDAKMPDALVEMAY